MGALNKETYKKIMKHIRDMPREELIARLEAAKNVSDDSGIVVTCTHFGYPSTGIYSCMDCFYENKELENRCWKIKRERDKREERIKR